MFSIKKPPFEELHIRLWTSYNLHILFDSFVICSLSYKECVLDVFIYLMALHQPLESNPFLLFSVVTVALPDESQK